MSVSVLQDWLLRLIQQVFWCPGSEGKRSEGKNLHMKFNITYFESPRAELNNTKWQKWNDQKKMKHHHRETEDDHTETGDDHRHLKAT